MFRSLFALIACLAVAAMMLVNTGCNETNTESPVATNAQAGDTDVTTQAAAVPGENAGDAKAAGGGCGGNCGGMAEGASAEGGCGGCGGGEAMATMASGEGSECGGDCGGEGDCSGEAKGMMAGGCSTCPNTAKAMLALAGDEKTVFKVDGMTCGSCEKAIKDTLAMEDGVKMSLAKFAEGKAWVAFDPKAIDAGTIKSKIEKLGYTVSGELEHCAALPALSAGHERAALYVDRMSCGDCTGKITEAINSIDGVDTSALDREFNLLMVDFDPAKVEPAALKAKVLEIGYAVALPGEALAQPENPHCDGCTGEEEKPVETADAA